MLKRLDEEEIAEHGETIADAFARAEEPATRLRTLIRPIPLL
jgi:hypothetical protein